MGPDFVGELMIVPERMQKDGEMLVGRLKMTRRRAWAMAALEPLSSLVSLMVER